ncbi:hypothetical protein L2U69_14690 [Zavarzinia compransoris]|uniref:hypothetical protein n=1 Tax=Zavarzinia marina TaxID=2911065 RepID=UPI001F28D03E|nr:hypothetical protein [Zavarzinia marina]MCF4166897.1 hypothetical protein [Zavarzinia marina]
MRIFALLATLALAATPSPAAFAAGGPAGRYQVDVDATYRALDEAGAATPGMHDTLTKQRDMMFLSFDGDRFSLIAGPGLGGGTKGTCHWTLSSDVFVFDDCRNDQGGAFSVDGVIRYLAEEDMLMIEGNLAVPVRYSRR